MPDSLLRGPPALVSPWSSLHAAVEARQGPWLVFHRGADTPTSLDGPAALALARRWAAALSRAGVKRGDRVGVLQPNGPDFIGAFFGASLLGAAAVPLPWPVMEGAPERTRDDSAHVLARAKLAALATTPAMAACAWPVTLVIAPADEPLTAAARAPDDATATAFVQFTSGSTGAPRGAMISHGAALASAIAMGQTLGLSPVDVGTSWIPFFHDMGLVGVVLCSLVTGFQVHVLRPAEFLLRPSRWFELVSRTRATITVGPNFGYELAARRGANSPGLELSALRLALNGSEPIHRQTLRSVEAAFGPQGYSPRAMTPVYGLAEATLGVAFSNGAADDLPWEGRQVVCCGRPLAGMEVRIARDGVALPEGAEGEVCVRGPMLMTGYFEDGEATSQALREGWLHTGDLGVVHQGALYLTGREKELVIKAGRKFHPYDIERVVAETVETTPNGVAAFSAPDLVAGSEALVVVVELRRMSSAEGATESIRARLMDQLGVRADRVELIPAGALPRTTSGKVKRRECMTRFSRVTP
jgi:acyl-CoA synthetase (AMP-forming)/AMP-acid ligase II